jgi:DNA-binding transcriptional MocR family regulator
VDSKMQEPIASVLGLWTQEKGPLYRRLAQALRQAIHTTEIPANTRLPAERALARELGISRNTVVAAYNELERAGLIERRHGSGTWVCSLMPQQTAELRAAQTKPLGRGPVFDAFLADHVDPIDLATGAVAWPTGLPVQPYLPTAEELSPVMEAYGYVPHGYQPLRQAIARSFTQRGIPTSADQVLVTTGAQQAILLIASCFLQRGDSILIESPTFFGALDAFRSLGLRCRAVPVDADGLHIERLQQQMASGLAQWLYLAPTIHNPTGTSLSIMQRHMLVRLAEQYGVTIIEDLTMADLRWTTSTLPPLATYAPQSSIISIGSLSKVVWGGMRIGWIRASSELISRLARFKAIQDLGSPLLSQVMAVRLLNDLATFSTHRRQELQRNLAIMEEYITHWLGSWTWKQPTGGLFLWLKLPRGDTRELAQEALHHGVLITPGPTLSVDEQHTQYVRLSYIRSPEEIIIGLERLREAWLCYEAHLPKIHPGISVTI